MYYTAPEDSGSGIPRLFRSFRPLRRFSMLPDAPTGVGRRMYAGRGLSSLRWRRIFKRSRIFPGQEEKKKTMRMMVSGTLTAQKILIGINILGSSSIW